MKKLLITIVILSAASLCGCANSAESEVSSESAASTTSSTTAQSTSATTIATTLATTTTTTTAGTTSSEAVTEITENADSSEPVVIEDNTPEPTKPEAETTPDGEYTLAETDLINEDGTYTQQLGTGDPSSISVPSFCTDEFSDWNSENASSIYRKGVSNPSKIPYSEITLENAAEAFPYMGFTGKHPGYIEILPTDDTNIVAMKIYNNIVGNEAINTGMNYEGYGFAYMPEHIFSSESEYDAYVAQQEAERAAADAADAKAREDSEAGKFGFDITDPDVLDALAGW